MPVKNMRIPGSSSLMGKITGLTDEEKKIINDNIDKKEIPTITITSLNGTLSEEDYQKVVDNDFVKVKFGNFTHVIAISKNAPNLDVFFAYSIYPDNVLNSEVSIYFCVITAAKEYTFFVCPFAMEEAENTFTQLQTFNAGIKVDGTNGVEIGSVRLTETSLQELEEQAEKIPNIESTANAAIPSSEKGTANGVAQLDSTGKVPSTQLPAYVPDLPEDADTKTYQLKAVNGTLTWVEEINN